MNTQTKRAFVAWFSIIIAVIAALGVLGLVVAEAYVRWKLNQNFTFLGGNELPALALGTFGLIAALVHTSRS